MAVSNNKIKFISQDQYLQLEGLFALMKFNRKREEEYEECVAEILRTPEEKNSDTYDVAYPLIDNMYDQSINLKSILKKYDIVIKTK